MAAHIAPEAARGGPIAALRDGDTVTIDVDSRRIDVALEPSEISERLATYAPPARANGRVEVAIDKYAKLVGSAAQGAITR
jgi:dihydroxy-acid dehydratase